MEVGIEILNKARKAEAELSDFDRCLNVLVCPRCGSKLTLTRSSCFSDVMLECTRPCKFIHRRKRED